MATKHTVPTKKTSAKKSKSRAGKSGSGQPWWLWLLLLASIPALMLAVYMLYLQAVIAEKLATSQWQEAAAIYARPLMLENQGVLAPADVLAELNLLGYRRVDTLSGAGQFLNNDAGLSMAVRAVATPEVQQKPQTVSLSWSPASAVNLRDHNAKPLARIYLEPQLLARWQPQQREDRELVRLKDVPRHVVSALLTTEDKQFYEHHGFSVRAILRAAWQNYQAGEREQGGSTITQQLVKNYFLSAERRLIRKINELLMAIVLEWNYDKNAILEAYLNEIYFGQDGDRAIHGIGLAARFYFAKPVQELDVAEGALLVGLIKGPSVYSPLRFPQRALERRNLVLQLMAENGDIPAEQLKKYQAQALLPTERRHSLAGQAPAVLDLVKREWAERLKSVSVAQSGLQIHTSIDPIVQEKAQQAVSEVMAALDTSGQVQAAMVITDRRTMAVRALVGERDGRSGFNRALNARRAVGSSLKPMIFYAALKQPELFSLATPLQDTSFVMRADDGRQWQPKNYDGISHGLVPLHEALAQSYNLATARTAMEIGLPALEQEWRQMGLRREFELVPSLALGALDLSPLELAEMYSGLANAGTAQAGQVRRARILTGLQEGEQAPVQLHNKASAQLDARTAFLTAWAMQQVVSSGTAKKLGALFPERKIAGKTGTTNDKRDAWFTAFDDNYLITIWIGRDDNKATSFTGASAAVPVYARLQQLLTAAPLNLTPPKGIVWAAVSGSDGLRLSGDCTASAVLPVDTRTPQRDCADEFDSDSASQTE